MEPMCVLTYNYVFLFVFFFYDDPLKIIFGMTWLPSMNKVIIIIAIIFYYFIVFVDRFK